jgi:tRNA (guanine37-N1)-methyltransferase
MRQSEATRQAGFKELDGIFIPAGKTQKTLELLRKLEFTIEDFQFQRNGGTVGIPLAGTPSAKAAKVLKRELGSYQIRKAQFEIIPPRHRTLREATRDRLPSDLISELPHSIDIIGDIAIVELAPALEPYSEPIAKALVEINPHVRLVLRKSGNVSGTYRTREFQTVLGRDGTETVHNEFACHYKVDVSTVYFNPRLGNERRRVAGEVKVGETIVDMFAGVGPYSVLIAKVKPQTKVYAIDINPSAVRYLRENVLINEVADRVVPILGDAGEVSRTQLHNVADRVVMNLPSRAEEFVESAIQLLKPSGGVIHFYQFVPRGMSLTAVKDQFRSSVRDQNRRVHSISHCEVIREIAPTRVQIALDAMII